MGLAKDAATRLIKEIRRGSLSPGSIARASESDPNLYRRSIKPLGEGRTGRVHLGISPVTHRPAAVKIFRPGVDVGHEAASTHMGRKALRGTGVIVPRVHTTVSDPRGNALVSGYVQGTSLDDAPATDSAMDRLHRGLRRMNRRGVAHGDLALQNVRVSGERPAIIDWGSAHRVTPGEHNESKVLARELRYKEWDK